MVHSTAAAAFLASFCGLVRQTLLGCIETDTYSPQHFCIVRLLVIYAHAHYAIRLSFVKVIRVAQQEALYVGLHFLATTVVSRVFEGGVAFQRW